MLSAGQILNGNGRHKSFVTMAVQTKSNACSWKSKGKLATSVAVSLDINPNACSITTAFLYTKQHCQKQKTGLWHAQVHVSGQSYQVKELHREMHDLHIYSKSHYKRAYKLAMFPQLHKGFLFSKRKNRSRKEIMLPSMPSFFQLGFSSPCIPYLYRIHIFFCSLQI